MEGERGILQNRVETAPIERRGIYPFERVRREQDEQPESQADRPLHREHMSLQRRRQIVAVHGHGGTE